MSIGAVLNMILDPIFIYILNMGIAGAAVANVSSMAIVSLIIIYWFRGDTYINLKFKNFKFQINTIKEILSVGMPAGGEFLIMAILAGSINIILNTVAGFEGVAVFSLGSRVLMLLIILVSSVSIPVIAVVGASFGGGKYENLNIIANYSMKLGTLIAIITAVATFILAPYIAELFTYSPEARGLSGLIIEFIRVISLFYILVPIGATAVAIFQGLGRGFESFMLITIRELLLVVVFAYILAIPLGFGQYGVWWGMVIGSVLGSLIGLVWSKLYIKKVLASKNKKQEAIQS
jgi:Na+-driven multidrug efflux pump